MIQNNDLFGYVLNDDGIVDDNTESDVTVSDYVWQKLLSVDKYIAVGDYTE